LSLDPADGSLGEIAARLHARVVGHVFKPGIIIDKMLEIAWHPALAGPVIQPERAPALRDIAGFALEAYLRHEDFTLLHMVTGCHAFRLIEGYASDRALARRYLWQAAVAAYLTVSSQVSAMEEATGCALGTDAIARLATRASDDHVIKLCYSALCEYRQYGNSGYLRAAWRKLEMAGLLDGSAQPAC
jgi:hypothetical protein